MTDEELVTEILKNKNLLSLYMQPRIPDPNKMGAHDEFMQVSDPHVYDAWYLKHAQYGTKVHLFKFFNGLDALFFSMSSRTGDPRFYRKPEYFLFERYRAFMLGMQKLIRANLVKGEFVEGNRKPILEFFASKEGKGIADYLKYYIRSLQNPNQEFNDYLQKKQIKYLPKQKAITPQSQSEALQYLEQARIHLIKQFPIEDKKIREQKAELDSIEDDKSIEVLDRMQGNIEFQYPMMRFRQQQKQLTDSFKAILRSEEGTLLREDAIKDFLTIFHKARAEFSNTNLLGTFCNTPIEVLSSKGEKFRQIPLILAMAFSKDKNLQDSLQGKTKLDKFLKQPENDGLVKQKHDGPIEQVIHNLQKINADLEQVLKTNLNKEYNAERGPHKNRFYSYKKYRDAALNFLDKIKTTLLQNSELDMVTKGNIYLGALNYIQSLVLAEHKNAPLNWRYTETKSVLEKLIERDLEKTTAIFGSQNVESVQLYKKSLEDFLKGSPDIEKKTLDVAYTSHKKERRMEIFQDYADKLSMPSLPKPKME